MNKTIQTVESAASGSAFLIEDIYPLIDGGRFAVKRIAAEPVEVWADIYRDGDAVIGAALIWRGEQDREWRSEPMIHHGNDRWSGAFTPTEPGQYVYAIEAWTDEFATWRHNLARKQRSGADVSLDAIEGAGLLTKAHGARQDAADLILRQCEDYLRNGDVAPLLAAELSEAMSESQSRPDLTRSPLFPLIVDRDKARFGAWYQMMPRSQSNVAGRHGTLRDCIARVPDIAAMGFDVLYFTPIHPIGRTRRKGRNNAPVATEAEPGSPYAIGAAEGGHDALHPELGTIEDFRALVATCLEYGLELALDFAVQCSPDHPWLTQHPEWFKWRPDRSVRTADGPYSDIVIPDFNSRRPDRTVERVSRRHAVLDRPWRDHLRHRQSRHRAVPVLGMADPRHPPPASRGDPVLQDIRAPEDDEGPRQARLRAILQLFPLAHREVGAGAISQRAHTLSRTRLLSAEPVRQHARSPALSSPERRSLGVQVARRAGGDAVGQLRHLQRVRAARARGRSPAARNISNSEKYQIKQRDWDKPGNIKPYIAELNRIRNENAALQQTANLRFLGIEDGETIAFVKEAADPANVVVGVIALSRHAREFWLPLGDLTVDAGGERRHVTALENLLTGEQSRIEWGGIRLRIDPDRDPALLFRCLA